MSGHRSESFIRGGTIDVADIGKALTDSDLLIEETTQEQWEERWFDGASWPLLNSGLGCRLKKSGQGADYIVELGPVPRSTFEYCHQWQATLNCVANGQLPQDDMASVLEREFSLSYPEDLDERLSVVVYQRSFALVDSEGNKGKLSLSSLQATMGRRENFVHARFSLSGEANVELPAGTLEELFLSLDFAKMKRSVLDHILAVYGASGRTLKKPPRPTIAKKDKLADVAQKVFAYHCDRMLANEMGTKVGLDPEYLHDMRVATRRMRSAFSDFGSCYEEDDLDYLVSSLRWIADFLGDVRDLDVQMEDLDKLRHDLPNLDGQAFDKIFAMLEIRRQRARQNMLVELSSKRYADFVDSFEKFIEKNPVRSLRAIGATVSPTTSAKEAARELLALRTQKAFKRGKKACRKLCDESLHRLRIQRKKLRYLAEFFRSSLDKAAVSQFIEQLVSLQDLIGEQHDAVVACQRLHETAELIGEKTETAKTLEQLVEASRKKAENLRQQIPQSFSTFKEFVKSEKWQAVLQDE